MGELCVALEHPDLEKALDEAVRLGKIKIVEFADGTKQLDSGDQDGYENLSDYPDLTAWLRSKEPK